MTIEIGAIRKYEDYIVVITGVSVVDRVWINNFFTGNSHGNVLECDLSNVDTDVGKFLSLLAFAPSMTHDEIKGQIWKLFKVNGNPVGMCPACNHPECLSIEYREEPATRIMPYAICNFCPDAGKKGS